MLKKMFLLIIFVCTFIISFCGYQVLATGNTNLENNTENVTINEVESETTTTNADVSDGVYIIATKSNNSKVLDISAGSTDNNANLQIWDNARVDQQKFQIKKINDGYYTITCIKSSKVLDVAGAGTKDGTNVWQYTNNGTDAQKWAIKKDNIGNYYFVSKCNGLYLNISNKSLSNSTNINVSRKSNLDTQKFTLIKPDEFYGRESIKGGIYTIKAALNESKVLDVSAASLSSGANIQLWDNVNVSQQKFIITYKRKRTLCH